MTQRTRLGLRLRVIALATVLGAILAPGVGGCVRQYRAIAVGVVARHGVVALGLSGKELGDVGRWQDEYGRWHVVAGIETVGGRH